MTEEQYQQKIDNLTKENEKQKALIKDLKLKYTTTLFIHKSQLDVALADLQKTMQNIGGSSV